MSQCDSKDGVTDGFITNPHLCKPDLSSLSCSQSGANQTSCLNDAQINTMYKIWGNYTTETNAGAQLSAHSFRRMRMLTILPRLAGFPAGTYIFPGFEPGAEASPAFSVSGSPYGPGPQFYLYQVLNQTNPKATLSVNETELERLYKIAVDTNPGQTNAGDPNISEFLKHGKLLTYVGMADTLIPTLSTANYYESVRTALGYPENLDDSYRFFTGESDAGLIWDTTRVLTAPTPQFPEWVTAVAVPVRTTLAVRVSVRTCSAASPGHPSSTRSTT